MNPLSEYRERNDRSVEWAAARLGVSTTTIRRWESGESRPSAAPRPHGNGSDWVMLAQLIDDPEQQWTDWEASNAAG